MKGTLTFALLWLACITAFAEDSVKFVTVILRHGARAARAHIKELENRVTWPSGKDALTPSGQRQLYLLGKMMHHYLIDQLSYMPPTYNESLITVRASGLARTIMSAESFLLGFYPDLLPVLTPDQLSRGELWVPPVNLTIPDYVKKGLGNSAVPFNIPPIPIQSHAHKVDKLLSFSSCERFSNNRAEYYKGEKFLKTHKAYNESLQKACEIVNIQCSSLAGRPVWEYVDFLLTAEFDGQLPELSQYPDLVDELEKFYTEIEHGELTHEPELMSPVALHDFSKTVPKYLEDAIHGVTPLKMVVLSTHESTMLSYLIAMGLEKKGLYETIPYGSNILIELRKKEGHPENNETSYYVNMTYNGKLLIPLKSFQEFKEWLEERGKLPGEWDEICKSPEVGNLSEVLENLDWGMVLIIALGVVTVIGIAAIIIKRNCARRNDEDLAEVSAGLIVTL